MKKIPILLGLVLLFMPKTTVFATIEDTLYSKGAVLIEKDSQRILYERKADQPLAMASTTKIMTCILALEKGQLDDVVSVSRRAAQAPKVKLFLETEEKQYLGDLLYSLMLESHNDSAVAIAEHIGGSVETFCEMMTEKAKSIGAKQTSFETPNGLDGKKHYATPHDMALITAYALENPKFIEIVTTLDKHIPSQPLEGSKPHNLINKNRFLREYPGAIGVKTGYTSQAGHCFVGAATRDDMTLIGVAFGAGWGANGRVRKYTDVKKMMNYGFDHYQKYTLVDCETGLDSLQVHKGKQDQIQIKYKDTITLPLTKEEKERIQIETTYLEDLEAPIEKQQKVGEVKVILEGEVLSHTDIVAIEDIPRSNLIDTIKKIFKKTS